MSYVIDCALENFNIKALNLAQVDQNHRLIYDCLAVVQFYRLHTQLCLACFPPVWVFLSQKQLTSKNDRQAIYSS